MKLLGIITGISISLTVNAQINNDFVPLKELFRNDFLVGVAVNGRSITGAAGQAGQTPAGFFTDEKGNQLTREQLYERLKIYMTAVMNRYNDVIFCWDVVNVAISDYPLLFDREMKPKKAYYSVKSVYQK